MKFTNLLGRPCSVDTNFCEIVGVDMSDMRDPTFLLLCNKGPKHGSCLVERSSSVRFYEYDVQAYSVTIIAMSDRRNQRIACVKAIRECLRVDLKQAVNISDGASWEGVMSGVTAKELTKRLNDLHVSFRVSPIV